MNLCFRIHRPPAAVQCRSTRRAESVGVGYKVTCSVCWNDLAHLASKRVTIRSVGQLLFTRANFCTVGINAFYVRRVGRNMLRANASNAAIIVWWFHTTYLDLVSCLLSRLHQCLAFAPRDLVQFGETRHWPSPWHTSEKSTAELRLVNKTKYCWKK